MADDQIPASPTPAGDPLPATPASVQPLDFSAVAGHQQHVPAPHSEPSPEVGQPEPEPPAAPVYHPDLQKIVDTHKVTDDPYKISHGSSFITPDGQYVHLPTGTSHADAIDAAKGKPGQEGLSTHSRKMFQNDTGAIKTKVTFDPETGHTLHVTVPDSGVNPKQVQALVKATKQALGGGKKGKVVMETVSRKQSAEKSDAKPEDIEPMLRNIGSHPTK